MQDIYTYIPDTSHVLREYNVAAILSLLLLLYYYYYIIIIIIIIIIPLLPRYAFMVWTGRLYFHHYTTLTSVS
jgi:hypothetical protein